MATRKSHPETKMASSGINANLVARLAEKSDPRLDFLWTAVRIAQQAGEVRSFEFLVGRTQKGGGLLSAGLENVWHRCL